ncbi:MAG: class I SAM-dependent methyltransferase [Anaerolineaceae bacterium]|jgi:SAM-dependent methyltransferase
MSDIEIKQQVRQFYDQIGWQAAGAGLYQNARYEDLRPVSQQYIRSCHLRINRHLNRGGKYLMDAGSGPIQYAEYLTYSQTYRYRVCLDLSIVALQEARRRIGEHGLYVVADVANLPFKPESFEGIVSLHTLHHLSVGDQAQAYDGLYRALAPGGSAVVVNGWTVSPLMRFFQPLVLLMERVGNWLAKRRRRETNQQPAASPTQQSKESGPVGTYVQKHNAAWLRSLLGGRMDFEIRVWRSVNVRFLRAVVHTALGGRAWLRILFWLEDRFPHFFGEIGQYPLIILRKP